MDIYYWNGHYIKQVTPFVYFETAGKLEGTTKEGWELYINNLLRSSKSTVGYYLVNHGNRRSLYLGSNWEIICEEIDGMYQSSNSEFALSKTPFDKKEYQETFIKRVISPLL